MAKLYFRYAAMNAGKSTALLQVAHNYAERGMRVMLFTAAIALFMPLCQLRRGNIIVDFFTTRCSAKTIQRLDQLGAILIAACFALLAWRTAVGGINAFRGGSGTMILGFPEWMTYAFMVPAFFLAGLIALAQGAGLMPDEKRLLP
ncbi:MAG: TRAP transporter small permease subunit [Betaproteobacteria bacterium]|nr:TRAP transporter small permease subunit [Betaproteobacteria bacterium]